MTVRWGFLGAGTIAKVLAQAVHEADGAVLQAAGARDLGRAQALGPVRAHGSYDDVVASPDVDAVYVALSNDAHLPWTLAALRAGKAVLCEKPLGLTAAEVDEMTAVAQETGGLLVEASWYRWHPRVRLAQQTLADIGTVRHVTAGFTFAGQLEGNYRLDPRSAAAPCTTSAATRCRPASGRSAGGCRTRWSHARSSRPAGWTSTPARSSPGTPVGRDGGAEAEVHAGISVDAGQWLVVRGDRGEIELRDAPYTSWKDDDTELWVSDGTGTERLPVRPPTPTG
jgi:hypothetical protein